jgi:UDP-N-acetylglucosamine 4,6-dehydratase/5-epimerase
MNFLKNKSVLITGGTGSFGKAFVSRLLKEDQISKLVIFSRDEAQVKLLVFSWIKAPSG